MKVDQRLSGGSGGISVSMRKKEDTNLTGEMPLRIEWDRTKELKNLN